MSAAKDALRGIMGLIDNGDIVINNKNDHDAAFFAKQRMRICVALKMTQMALAQHCQCRSGSPDTCPKCTDMETGEKYADQDVAD